MPELPEVEVISRILREVVINATIAQVEIEDENLKQCDLDSLVGKKFVQINRRGKYLLFKLSPSHILIVHLGMTGKLFWEKELNLSKKHLRAAFMCDRGTLAFYDQRRFGSLEVAENSKKLSHLGIEPLSLNFNPDALYSLTVGSSAQIKNLLMNQCNIAGIGNIYAQEILFKAGIHPQREACTLSRKEVNGLVKETKSTLTEAIKRGGSTIRDYEKQDGEPGEFQKFLKVYGREDDSCPRCGTEIKRIKQAGRSTYFCESCQK